MSGAIFVGFGFGAIQAGLFLVEAHKTGAFSRLVVAEINRERVARLRRAHGRYTVNVAQTDGIEQVEVGPVELYNPADTPDRQALVEAIAEAQELATALPTVAAYTVGGTAAVHQIVADGLQRKVEVDGPPAVVYCAENHNQAATLLQEAVAAALPTPVRDQVLARTQFLDTVIGKMSGLVTAAPALAPITAADIDAFLVEAFNRILISRIEPSAEFTGFVRRLAVFVEKAQLAPFEAAKLYCHNGGHATAAFLGKLAGLTTMDQLSARPDLLATARAAMVDEAGMALIARYAGSDGLFSPAAMAVYADDLLTRMVNPHLHDAIARVTRDPARKLGWDDRLIGALRLALAAQIEPVNLARGAAAAYAELQNESGAESRDLQQMRRLWPATIPTAEAAQVIKQVGAAWKQFAKSGNSR